MQADYGGTEIRQAIEQVLDSRATWTPTAVFVLTDGEVRCAYVPVHHNS
jgi:hypothetical protein